MERIRAADPTINHKITMTMAVAAWKNKDKTQAEEGSEVTLESILSA